MSDPNYTLMGPCSTRGKPDQYHGLCDGHFRSQFGIEWVCSCPNHTPGKPDGNGMIGATNKAAPGGASTPLSQGLADDRSVD